MFNKILTHTMHNNVTLEKPVSQLCTFSQFESPEYTRICDKFDVIKRFHRKQWEFVYVIKCLEDSGFIKKNNKGLAFGVGKEKLPSFLAENECYVTATDLDSSDDLCQSWQKTNQHCAQKQDLFYKNIISEEKFNKFVEFKAVDMNSIPDYLKDYDFCWSSCSLEHLGSLKHGLDFIKNSLDCLKPGGVAVHTTEFNLSSNENTFESKGSSVYRKKDIEQFAEELLNEGHELYLNFDIGNEPEDLLVDFERNNKNYHLKITINDFITTSFGFYIKKKK